MFKRIFAILAFALLVPVCTDLGCCGIDPCATRNDLHLAYWTKLLLNSRGCGLPARSNKGTQSPVTVHPKGVI